MSNFELQDDEYVELVKNFISSNEDTTCNEAGELLLMCRSHNDINILLQACEYNVAYQLENVLALKILKSVITCIGENKTLISFILRIFEHLDYSSDSILLVEYLNISSEICVANKWLFLDSIIDKIATIISHICHSPSNSMLSNVWYLISLIFIHAPIEIIDKLLKCCDIPTILIQAIHKFEYFEILLYQTFNNRSGLWWHLQCVSSISNVSHTIPYLQNKETVVKYYAIPAYNKSVSDTSTNEIIIDTWDKWFDHFNYYVLRLFCRYEMHLIVYAIPSPEMCVMISVMKEAFINSCEWMNAFLEFISTDISTSDIHYESKLLNYCWKDSKCNSKHSFTLLFIRNIFSVTIQMLQLLEECILLSPHVTNEEDLIECDMNISLLMELCDNVISMITKASKMTINDKFIVNLKYTLQIIDKSETDNSLRYARFLKHTREECVCTDYAEMKKKLLNHICVSNIIQFLDKSVTSTDCEAQNVWKYSPSYVDPKIVCEFLCSLKMLQM